MANPLQHMKNAATLPANMEKWFGTSQMNKQMQIRQPAGIEYLKQSSLPMPAAIMPPSGLSLSGIYSSTGFDMLSVMGRISTRANPVIAIGPVDLSCSFLITDARKPDCPIVYASETFERLTGYSGQEIVGRNCRFLQAPDAAVEKGSVRKYTDNNVVFQMRQAVEETKECQFTLINYKKSGEPFINLITVIPISLHRLDQVDFFVGLQIDLVDQPQAILNKMKDGTYNVNYQIPHVIPRNPKEQVSSYAADVQSLMTQTAVPSAVALPPLPEVVSNIAYGVDFIHILSLRGMFLYCSPVSCRQLLEYDAAEIMGHSLSEFVHPADLVGAMRDLKVAQTGERINVVCRFKRKYTGYIYVELRGHLYEGESGKRTKCFIMSGREKRVGRLSARDTLPSNVTVVDTPEGKSIAVGASETWGKISPEGLILYSCNNSTEVFGRSPDDLYAHNITEFLHPEDRYNFTSKMEAVAQDQRPIDIVCRVILPPRSLGRDPVVPVMIRAYAGAGIPSATVFTQIKVLSPGAKSLLPPAHSLPSPISTPQQFPSPGGPTPGSSSSGEDPSTPRTSSSSLSTTTPLNSTLLQGLLVYSDLYEGGNLFDIMAPTRATSLHYELNQLKAQNKRLREEVDNIVFCKKPRMEVVETPICCMCGTTSSPEWRRGSDGLRNVCNACGLRANKLR
ncbi:hypothetical protein SmJEL517_g00414 [Synchytrium microbalum]|uniref:PAS domain-containing protein n=1 Tax=Synchytrium microbalum TaxID=1806994 RepID=A0A507CK09_9FUNG|nr:uncharacterized protein SmJEL517_g00414 [Synchytrium microbalum]TPX38215.1 hypothetical protein SmJEL517_g00414 [Synchytrium microbalum]